MANYREIERCVEALLAVTQGMRLCEEVTAAKYGMSAAQLAILAALSRNEQRSVGQLAEELHLDQSSVSAHAKVLLSCHMIRRVTSTDARRVEFALAARARNIIGKIGYTGRPLVESALANVPVSTLRGVVPDLRRIAEAMIEQREMVRRGELQEA
jgi:DNA-binding MarR family transcriptional regulator